MDQNNLNKESFDYSQFDWNKVKKQYKPKQNSYYCSYNESHFKCGCIPTTVKIDRNDNDGHNILFIAKLGDMEVYPIIYSIIQVFNQESQNCVFYGSELIVKELNKINQHCKQKKCVEEHTSSQINYDSIVQFDQEKHEQKINLLITIGGDGTILYGMRFFQNRTSPPMMCFEKGTLGFMAMNVLEHFQRDVMYVLKNAKENSEIQVENKMRLQGVLVSKEGKCDNHIFKYHALNEFVIERGSYSSVLKIDIFVNEIYLTTFWGDGIIVSTPTGSTAYNLSAGGPIMQNEVGSIVLTPICPFSLSFRPLVIPRCSKLKFVLADDVRGHGQINADGQKTYEFKPCDQIIIEESEYSVNQVRSSENFFEDWVDKLKRLLNWNNTSFTKKAPQLPTKTPTPQKEETSTAATQEGNNLQNSQN